MTETPKRAQYRMTCKHYNCNGMCMRDSGYYGDGMHILFACTPETKCPRLKRYDKLNKE
jgi:hypothetical protein